MIGWHALNIYLILQDSSVTINIRQIGVSAWTSVTSINQRYLLISFQVKFNNLSQHDIAMNFESLFSIYHIMFNLRFCTIWSVLTSTVFLRSYSANCRLGCFKLLFFKFTAPAKVQLITIHRTSVKPELWDFVVSKHLPTDLFDLCMYQENGEK
jgi:hypothetical protein